MAAELLERVRAEVDARIAQLRPAVAEYERLLGAMDMLAVDGSAGTPAKPRASAKPRAAVKRRAATTKPRAAAPAPARLGAGERAIVAALEHGSHTVGELGVVTAMSGAEIRESARLLLSAGRVVRARRDGRAAYALSGKA